MNHKELMEMKTEFPDLHTAWKLLERDREIFIASKDSNNVERVRAIQIAIEYHYIKLDGLKGLQDVIKNFLSTKKVKA